MPNLLRSGLAAALGLPLLLAGPAWAQSSPESATPAAGGSSRDCTEVSVDYTDVPGLTREERIARMDRALTRSLNRFDECGIPQDAAASGGGGQAGGGAGGGQAGGGAGGGQAGGEASVASGDISGEGTSPSSASGDGQAQDSASGGGEASVASGDISGEGTPPSSAQSPEEASGTPDPGASGPETAAADPEASGSLPPDGRDLPNGRPPADIPPADNDSIFEAQLREAALKEKDPEQRKHLWNEYRSYKGLPQER